MATAKTAFLNQQEMDLRVPTKTYPWVTTNRLAVFVNDYEAGEYRDSTRKDIAAFTRLVDAVDSFDFLKASHCLQRVLSLAECNICVMVESQGIDCPQVGYKS
jgi:trimethylamine:corrinoid methyltransferase-like protein